MYAGTAKIIFPFDSRAPPYKIAITRPSRSKIGLPDDPGASYASTCTTDVSALLTVPTVSVGSAIGWPPCASIGRWKPTGYARIAARLPPPEPPPVFPCPPTLLVPPFIRDRHH